MALFITTCFCRNSIVLQQRISFMNGYIVSTVQSSITSFIHACYKVDIISEHLTSFIKKKTGYQFVENLETD